MRTFGFRAVAADLIVCVGGSVKLSDEDWTAYLELVRLHVPELRATHKPMRTIVFAEQSGPDAKQRASIWEAVRGVSPKTAVVTSNAVVRYITTAVHWLGMPTRAFAPEEISQATDYLGLGADELRKALDIAHRLAAEVGGNRCVDVAARHVDTTP